MNAQMKLKSWFGSSVILGFLAIGAGAAELQIDPAKIGSADNIPGWEIFQYVKDGSVSLETVGDDKALKVSAETGKKGLMLILKEAIKCNKGEKITFAFTAKGKGLMIGGAYLFDAVGKQIGGVYGAAKDIKSDDEWSDFVDAKDIPSAVDGNAVASIQPYLIIRPGSEVFLKSLNYKIATP